jgi:RNA polymerase sigma-70 factor (ECF subfamily)
VISSQPDLPAGGCVVRKGGVVPREAYLLALAGYEDQLPVRADRHRVAEAERPQRVLPDTSGTPVTFGLVEVFSIRVLHEDVVTGPRADEATSSFDGFYEGEYVRLFRALLLLTGSREEAEDLCHDSFVRVLQRWDRVSAMESPAAYLFRTAFNLRRNSLRRLRRRPRDPAMDPSSAQDASALAIARAEVFRALTTLSREQREAVILVDLLEFTSEGAAEILRIDAAAVRARLHRGRRKLQKELTEDE